MIVRLIRVMLISVCLSVSQSAYSIPEELVESGISLVNEYAKRSEFIDIGEGMSFRIHEAKYINKDMVSFTWIVRDTFDKADNYHIKSYFFDRLCNIELSKNGYLQHVDMMMTFQSYTGRNEMFHLILTQDNCELPKMH
jgi:hypothetical protein